MRVTIMEDVQFLDGKSHLKVQVRLACLLLTNAFLLHSRFLINDNAQFDRCGPMEYVVLSETSPAVAQQGFLFWPVLLNSWLN